MSEPVQRGRLSPDDYSVIKKLYKEGATAAELSKRYKVTINYIYQLVNGDKGNSFHRKHKVVLQEKDLERIYYMLDNGATVKNVAQYFGVSEAAAEKFIKEHPYEKNPEEYLESAIKPATIIRKPQKNNARCYTESEKINEQQVRELFDLYKSKKYTRQELAKKYGISEGLVTTIVNGRAWKHLNLLSRTE